MYFDSLFAVFDLFLDSASYQTYTEAGIIVKRYFMNKTTKANQNHLKND